MKTNGGVFRVFSKASESEEVDLSEKYRRTLLPGICELRQGSELPHPTDFRWEDHLQCGALVLGQIRTPMQPYRQRCLLCAKCYWSPPGGLMTLLLLGHLLGAAGSRPR